MAGDWIKFESGTSDKPEVWAIAQDLNIDPDAVVGKLLRVWSWFDQHTENGNAPTVTKMLLDRVVGVTGFCDSIIKAGWMIEQDSLITLPNFDRHNGKTAKNRATTAKRVASFKEKKRIDNDSGNDKVTPAPLPREEKRREDKPKIINNTPAGELAEFDISRFVPSDDDMAKCDGLVLDSPLDQIAAEFRVYHRENGTNTTAANWSRLFQGWVKKRVLPPTAGGVHRD